MSLRLFLHGGLALCLFLGSACGSVHNPEDASTPQGDAEVLIDTWPGNDASSQDASQDDVSTQDAAIDVETSDVEPIDVETDTTSPPSGTDLKPLYPAEGWDVTDIAVSFRWKSAFELDPGTGVLTGAKSYQLQVDDDEGFGSPEVDAKQSPPVASYEGDEEMFARWSHIAYTPSKLLAPGTYYWRVRAADSSDWSMTTSFTVNDDHTQAPLVRPITPSAPLFSFDMFYDTGNDPLIGKLPQLHANFPESIRPFVTFAIQHEPMGMNPELDGGYDGTLTDLLKPLAEAQVPVLIKDGGPDKDFQQFTTLAELEHIFKAQPNVIGLVQGETFWDFIDAETIPSFYENQVQWYKKTFVLAAKYGRVVIFGNGNDEDFVWDKFLGKEAKAKPWMDPDEIKALAPYLILTPKNNIPFGYFHAESAIVGAWLTGMVDNWGVWSEGWAWGSIGYDALFGPQLAGDAEDPDFSTMPYNLWLQMKLAGLSQGATVFHFGGESSVVEWGEYNPETGHFDLEDDEVLTQSTAFWDMEGNQHPALERYIIPFLKAVVNKGLIPSKAEVLDKVKLAVAAPSPETAKGSALDYGVYAALIRTVFAIDDYVSIEEALAQDEDAEYYEMVPNPCRRELLHNEGRYYIAPILPYPAKSLGDGTPVLELDALDDVEKVQTQFDAAYPMTSTGSAWVVRVGDRITITNSSENTDITQDFSLEVDGVGTLSGVIGPHAYLLVKLKDGEVWMMANAGGKGNYTDDRITRVDLSLASEAKVTPLHGDVTSNWKDGVLSIELKNQSGAAEANVEL